MTEGILIGIDAGTSVIKSVAFDLSGRMLATAAIPNQYHTLANGGVEQDMPRTWADAAQTLRELAEKLPRFRDRVLSIAVTGQGDGMWLVDKVGEPVAPAWLWLDARAASVVEEFTRSDHYAAHYGRTGTGVNVCQMSVQLALMNRQNPDVLRKATHAFHCKDWIYFKLTGDRVTDPSEANFTFGNFATRDYAPDILSQLGAGDAARLLPPIVDGTVACGSLSAEAASLVGLKVGTPISLGYVDVICTGLGGGLYDVTGQSGCTIVGSTGMHMRLVTDVSDVKLNAECSGYTMAFPVPGMVAQIQSNMASTINIDWLLDLARGLFKDRGEDVSRAQVLRGMDDKVLARKAAKLLYHPYISLAGERGPFMEPAARAMFSGLDVTSDYYDMMRAVFEGLGFAARDCYAAMGDMPQEIRITGGAARSHALRLILASALNAKVRNVTREEAGAAGAAMMAAVQQKIYPDMSACAEQWVTPYLGDVTMPDRDLGSAYDGAFSAYVETRKAMRPIWRQRNS